MTLPMECKPWLDRGGEAPRSDPPRQPGLFNHRRNLTNLAGRRWVRCPDCGGPLAAGEGHVSCPVCGFLGGGS